MSASALDFDTWRDPDVLATLPPPREPIPHGWHDLEWVAQTDRRDAIRIYARLGLHPIALHGLRSDGLCTCDNPECPPRTRGKHPVCGGWQRAPFDLNELDRMLISNWRLNIGLRMGLQPGGFDLITIDIDGPPGLLGPLEAENGPLPPTLTQRTGSGGLHLILRVDDSSRFRNAVKIAPGIDVRSRGGQIVAAPSKHYSGATYEWLTCIEPAELPQ